MLDATALDVFVREHHDRLVRLARLVCLDTSEAADAVQGALEQAWRRRSGLRDPASLRPWLDRIVVREAIRLDRRRRSPLGRLFGGPTELMPLSTASIASGPDGSVWIANSRWSQDAPLLRLARFDGQSWTEFTAPSDIRPALLYWDENHLPPAIASDGSVWLRTMHPDSPSRTQWAPGGRCDGVARFDGTAWSTYLANTCVTDIAPGPDGSVWVATFGAAPSSTVGGPAPDNPVYLIRP